MLLSSPPEGRRQCRGFAFSTNARCRNLAPPWFFCRWHVWQPVLILRGLLGFGADVTGLWSYIVSPPPATRQQADQLLAQDKEGLDGIKRLEQMAERKRDQFRKEFPLGYALFFADDRTEIYRVDTEPPGVTVDWREVRLVKRLADRVLIQVPRISLALPPGCVREYGSTFQLPTNVGSGGAFNIGGGYWLRHEVLEVDGRGIVFLIGVTWQDPGGKPHPCDAPGPAS